MKIVLAPRGNHTMQKNLTFFFFQKLPGRSLLNRFANITKRVDLKANMIFERSVLTESIAR